MGMHTPQPRQASTRISAAAPPSRRSTTRGTEKGQASSQAPQATQRDGSTAQTARGNSRFQTE
jgi:hypothetical protein